ncbi:MAG: hypothetical protein Q8928_07030 [Bacteroidota bacterium]|nr:hypothetical protein [Bacteroidota bacterium]
MDYDSILDKYCLCMNEIKLRIDSIRSFIVDKKTTGYKYTDTEFICLQFRKILELIALANLVSNSEKYNKQYSNFVNHYHAKHILRDIEKINPLFYPVPIRHVYDKELEKKGIKGRIEEIKEGYLTLDEFTQIYDECSDFMHAENPFAVKKNLDDIRSKFPIWLDKILILLNNHKVQLIDINRQIWVILETTDKNVQAALFENVVKK